MEINPTPDTPEAAPGAGLSAGPRGALLRLAWVPIPLLLAVIAGLWVADARVAWPVPSLFWFIHYGSGIIAVAFIVIPATLSFLANRQPSVLMLGCGVLVSEIGVLAMPSGFARSANAAFAIYNTSILLSALGHFTGVAVAARRSIPLSHGVTWLTAAFTGGAATMALVIWAALTGRMPTFFVDGQGGTLLRSLVVGAAVVVFSLTAGLLWQTNRRTPSPFLHWYAMGLVLLAIGLAGSMLIAVIDSPLQWAARSTQLLGMLYMCMAVLASARSGGAKSVPLAAVEDAWRAGSLLASFAQRTPLGWLLRWGLAVVAVAAAMGLRVALTAWVGHGLPTYITFYPAVMAAALLAGIGPGLLATALTVLTAAYWILSPTGQFAVTTPVDRLGLVIFAGMGLFMSVVAEIYRRDRRKAAAYDREAALRGSREALRESEARYRSLFNSMTEGFAIHEIITDDAGEPVDYRFLDINAAFERLTGLKRQDVVGRAHSEVMPGDDPKWLQMYGRVALTGEPVQFENYAPTLKRHYEVFAYQPAPRQFAVIFMDVTSTRKAQLETAVASEFLKIINQSTDTRSLVHAAVTFFHEQSRCEAVGVRLKDGDDFPYYEARGFPEEFLLLENSLCERDDCGNLQRDSVGNPCIACMCGNVICGRFDPSRPFFSPNGSFWANDTTRLLATTTAADRQANTRNRCNGEGYESVALIPLIAGEQRLGLLQLNDKRNGMFSADAIALWERLAAYLAVALAKLRAEEALRESQAKLAEAMRKRAEEALRMSEQEFRSLAEAMPQIVWATRADGWNIYFNQQWVDYTGMTMEDSHGHGWNAPFHPDDKQRAWEAWQRATQHNEHYSLECRLRRADGVYRWWLIRGVPMLGANGEIVKWFGTCTDIEEIKRVEATLHEANDLLEQRVADRTAALRESERLYRAIGESIDYGIWVCDAQGRNTYASESFLKLVGMTQAQCSDLGWGDVLHPDDIEETIAAWKQCVQIGGPWYREHRFRGADGQWHPILACGVAVRDERNEVMAWAGINLDISQLKRTEATLRATVDELARSNKDLEQFAYIASHDLQEPLRQVRAFVQLLRDRHSEALDGKAAQYMEFIVDGASRMSDLVKGLLAYSRAGARDARTRPVPCQRSLDTAMANLQASIAQSHACITHDDLPTVTAEPTQLTQLFQNLLGNAIKFRRDDVPPAIHVGCRRDDGGWVFSVKDNGIGIDSEHREKVFLIFQRLHGRGKYPGTGIGLAICKRIVEQHGGRIWIESTRSEGATFHFTLPG